MPSSAPAACPAITVPKHAVTAGGGPVQAAYGRDLSQPASWTREETPSLP